MLNHMRIIQLHVLKANLSNLRVVASVGQLVCQYIWRLTYVLCKGIRAQRRRLLTLHTMYVSVLTLHATVRCATCAAIVFNPHCQTERFVLTWLCLPKVINVWLHFYKSPRVTLGHWSDIWPRGAVRGAERRLTAPVALHGAETVSVQAAVSHCLAI